MTDAKFLYSKISFQPPLTYKFQGIVPTRTYYNDLPAGTTYACVTAEIDRYKYNSLELETFRETIKGNIRR